jgi:nicotinamidase/pyrazinamidase
MRADAALLVIDVQNSFVEGGALAVPQGSHVVPVINRLMPLFAHVVLTQDWHPAQHQSFASAHAGKQAFEKMQLVYGEQILWPDHCVQGTHGAELHADLHTHHADLILRKGCDPQLDSYSAFMYADRTSLTGLASFLKERGARAVYCCGLATDFCVAWTAIDARAAGFATFVVEDACRAIDLNGSLAVAWHAMTNAGVQRTTSAALA